MENLTEVTNMDYDYWLKNVNVFRTSIKYLGFIIDEKDRRTNPENIYAIKNMRVFSRSSKLQRSILPINLSIMLPFEKEMYYRTD